MVDSPVSSPSGPAAESRIIGPILVAVVLGAVVLLLIAFLSRSAPAPLATFVTLQGERITTGDLRGRVTVINFWATDCPICIKEMPDLARTYERFQGRGLELVAVAMQYDPPNYVIRYVEGSRLPFKVALDPAGEIARAFGNVRLTPTTFVIDKQGKLVLKTTGEVDFARLHQLLEEKLAERA
jgi:peroxiredoxin